MAHDLRRLPSRREVRRLKKAIRQQLSWPFRLLSSPAHGLLALLELFKQEPRLTLTTQPSIDSAMERARVIDAIAARYWLSDLARTQLVREAMRAESHADIHELVAHPVHLLRSAAGIE
jgi:hypothetical protein